MKKNIFIKGCLAVAALSLMTSCDDFLEEKPQSVYTTETFYTNESDFDYAVTAIYQAQLKAMSAPGDPNSVTSRTAWYGMFRFPSVRSDEKSLYHGINFYSDGAENFTDTETGGAKDYAWQYMYIIINRANSVLDRIDAFNFTTAGLQNELKGQALALRGWAYYQLGQWFGGVPIITTELSVEETLKIGRSSQAETFAQAEKDMRAAIALLPGKYTGDKKGRVGKFATEAMLARMLMFQNKSNDAKTLLEDVIRNGGYSLAPTYVDCFSEAGEGNGERVWYMNFAANQEGMGQSISDGWVQENYNFNPNNEPFRLVVSGGSHAISPNQDLIDEHEAGDTRRNEYVTNMATAYSSDYYFCIKFNHYETFPNNANNWGVDIPLMRYADVLLMYAECLGQGAGDQYLNEVRKRAGLGPWTDYSNDFTTALRHERRLELAFEGIRWFDLVRWGIAKSTMNAYLSSKEGGAKCNPGETTGTPYYQMADGQEVFAIPQTEIDLYNNRDLMWQNEAYTK